MVLVPVTVIAVVVVTVMMTLEVITYGQYQSAKNRPSKLVLTREFLEAIEQHRYLAQQQGI